jgi:2,3-bisphosphoglycerate-dependent phosphoglycerate mutase
LRLLLIRHAQSEGNAQGRLQGRKEYALSELGVTQAAELAERLGGEPIAAVYSSPIRRAYDTAEALAKQLDRPIVTESRVQEYDFGEKLSGLTWQEIRDLQPEVVSALVSGGGEFPSYPGEEGRGVFRTRVAAAMSEIAERHLEDEVVAVVTHAGPVIVYLMEILGRAYTRPIPFAIDNASITTVEFPEKARPFQPPAVVTGINDTCHLKATG